MEHQEAETSPVNNPPGVYRHPQTGVRLVARPARKSVTTSVQADAMVRQGMEYVGPLPPRGETVNTYPETAEAESHEETQEETQEETGSYEQRVDKRGVTYFVGPRGQRVSREEYEANA